MSTAPLSRLSIYEAGRHDIDDVMAVMTEAFDPDFGEAWSRGQCLGILGQPGVWLTLVKYGGEPAGFALCRIVADEAELLLLGVRPLFRRMGIGRKLLERFCASAASLGAARLHLEVREGNEAVELYRSLGFDQVGCRKNYYRGKAGDRYNAITLALLLHTQNM